MYYLITLQPTENNCFGCIKKFAIFTKTNVNVIFNINDHESVEKLKLTVFLNTKRTYPNSYP